VFSESIVNLANLDEGFRSIVVVEGFCDSRQVEFILVGRLSGPADAVEIKIE
jgi:hypothetical protein